MANDLSQLLPVTLAQALQVLRGETILPRLVNRDFDNVPAASGDTVNVWIGSDLAATDVTPGPGPVTPPDSTPTKVPITLNKHKKSGFHITDKERGAIAGGFIPQQVQQAVKALARQVNADLLGEYVGIFGFVGTPGTTPFASSLAGFKEARTLLNVQLAPKEDRVVILDPDAEGNAVVLPLFVQADQRGDQGGVLAGQIGTKMGASWWMDQQVPTHTAGTITTGLVAKASTAQAVGLKAVVATTAVTTGAANLKIGDIITFAGQTQTYTLTAAAVQAAASSDVTLNIEPGLKIALVGGEAVSVKGTHVVNIVMQRGAMAFASRPLQSEAANSANILSIADPQTGLALRIEQVRQNKQDYFELDLLYGVKLVRPELAVRLAG